MASKQAKSTIGGSKQKAAPNGARPKFGLKKQQKEKRNMPKRSSVFKDEHAQSTQITAPIATAAIVRRARTGPIRIKMTEEVSDVVVAPEFRNSPLVINPGNEELFPWLSNVAQQFTTYYFHKLKFRYVADTQTGLGGDVVLAVNADADKPAFLSIKEALNHEGSAQSAPWTSFEIDGKQPSSQAIGPKFVEDVTGEEGLSGVLDDLHTIADGVVQVVTGFLNLFSADSKTKELEAQLVALQNDPSKPLPGRTLTTDPPTQTGKFFVDYDISLMDPVTEQTEEDNGANYARGQDITPDPTNPPWWVPSASESGWISYVEGMAENPLRLDSTLEYDAGTAITQYLRFPEPGYYQFVAVHAFSTPGVETRSAYNPTDPELALSVISGGDILPGGFNSYAGVPTVTAFTGQPQCLAVLLQATVRIDGEGEDPRGQVRLQCSLSQFAYWDTPNSWLLITKMADSTASALTSLGQQLKGSLPDCPKNLALIHLRDSQRRSRTSANASLLRQEVSRMRNRLRKPRIPSKLSEFKEGYISVRTPAKEQPPKVAASIPATAASAVVARSAWRHPFGLTNPKG